MSYKYVIDSYAWVEYFRGSEQGKRAKSYIENEPSVTSAITIAELAEKYAREDKVFEEDANFILAKTKVIVINIELAQSAGEINAERKKKIKNWGMSDAIILATARSLSAQVVTGDAHFKDTNAIMIT